MIELSDNARKVFNDLYSFQGESIEQTFKRVVNDFAKNKEERDKGYNLLVNNIWRPNTPVFFNAGTDHKIFSACYVVGLEDSMDSIFDVSNVARRIFQRGAGVGIPIGNLRETNAYIYEGRDKEIGVPEGRSSGPLKFMYLYDSVGEITKSGGRVRRAAILCSMPVWHPDIVDFISIKEEDGRLSNMNISVLITDTFMKALEDGTSFDLLTPYDGSKVGTIDPREIWNRIADMAHKSAEPGVIFIDEVNRYNPLIKDKLIECTNPCVTGDTLISTPYGYRYVKDINEGDIIGNVCGIGKVETKEEHESVPVYEVKFSDGGKVKASASHQFHAIKKGLGKKAIKKFKPIRLDQLEIGDWIRVNPTLLPDNKTNIKSLYGLTDREYGFLVGVLIGDGCISENIIKYNRVKIATNQDDQEWNNYLEKILYKVGYTGVKDISKDSKSMCFFINGNTILLKIVKDLGIQGYSYEKRIPYDLLNSNKELLSGILDGIISTDGNIHMSKQNPLIRISTTSEDLVEDIRNILLMFGIHCCVGSDSKSTGMIDGRIIERKHIKFDICIVGSSIKTFYQNISISHSDKMNRLEKLVINYNLSGNTWKTKIKSIEYIGEERVYDLYEPKTDTWITNGYVSRGCGEQPLNPYNCCNLSAINLWKFVMPDKQYDWQGLYDTAKIVFKLMDNAIETMEYPDPRFKENALKYRPIGVGVMGLADALLSLELKYDAADGRNFAAEAMRTITTACVEASAELAAEHGPFHDYEKYREDMERIIATHTDNDERIMELVSQNGVRNCQYSTAMPTGTTALSCDASYGIEPLMGLVFQKNLISGEKMIIVNPIFEQKYKNEDWYSDVLLNKILNNGGSLKGIHGIPKEVRDIFVVAHDINYKARIDMQAELQKFCSTAISSTINLPKDTNKDEIADLYEYAYKKKLKGVTVYRDGCRKGQPVTFENNKSDRFIRPNKLNSQTYIIETGNGKMYTTVSDDNGKPVEIFLFLGKSGQLLNTFSEALGRTLSLALQNNVPLEELTKTLKGINSDSIAWHRFEDTDKRPSQILSIPDGIAKLLERYYLNKEMAYKNGESTQICSACGQPMIATEGCFSCVCGNSKCA